MGEDPASGPVDADRTVVRPSPGGRRPPSSRPGADETPEPSDRPQVAAADPLLAAAAPLLHLLAELRLVVHPPAVDLRARAARALTAFEKRAREAGVAMELRRPAHRVLCESLDEVALAAPWATGSAWAAAALTPAFHADAGQAVASRIGTAAGGDIVALAGRLRGDPQRFLPVLKLVQLCLALGVMGRCRGQSDGAAAIARLRAELHAAITAQEPVAPGLSPDWEGVQAPCRRTRRLPLWTGAVAATAIVAAAFAWCRITLNERSDAAYARLSLAAPAMMPAITRVSLRPPPQAVEAPIAQRLRQALAGGAEAEVLGLPGTTILRLPGGSLFTADGAELRPAAAALLARVGQALRHEAGRVTVAGYTDAAPVRSVRFPSNFQLSAARAAAVRAALAPELDDTSRLDAEGRGSADPLAPPGSPGARERNRRIEIIVEHPA